MLKKVALFIGFLFCMNAVNAQCAMCKAVVENGNVDMAEGVNNGITYLMIFPYLLIGLLLFAIYRYKRQLKN